MSIFINESDVTQSNKTTTVDLPRFGVCTYNDSEVISLPWGLPGFPKMRRSLVISVDGEERYVWLQSLDDHGVAIPLCDPWSLFDAYEAPLPHYVKVSLGIEAADSFCVMCVLAAPQGAGETTVNLLAPVVINLEKRVARQVPLENLRYSVRTPVPRNADASAAPAPS